MLLGVLLCSYIILSNKLGRVDSVLKIYGKSKINKQEALRVARSMTQTQ